MPFNHIKANGGMDAVQLTYQSNDVESVVVVYLFGGQVNSWKLNGKEQLFLSERTYFDGSKPIRGGIPVVFPQFGPNGPLAQHGFARTSIWSFDGATEDANAGLEATFTLKDSEATRAVWPHSFALHLRVHLRPERELHVTLEVENTCQAPFSFTALLHSYFAVGNVQSMFLTGLQDRYYVDQLMDRKEILEKGHELRIDREVDRIYKETNGVRVTIEDGVDRQVHITSRGFTDFVVFNPYSTRKMADLADDSYQSFVAAEPGVVSQPITLPPQGKWSGTEEIVVTYK